MCLQLHISPELQHHSLLPQGPPQGAGDSQLCHCLAGHPPSLLHRSDGREISVPKVLFRENVGDSLGQGWVGMVAVTAVGGCSY